MLGLLAAGAASAPIDLATRAPIRLLGAWPVAAAGDFNGDGWPDVVLGNPQLYRTRSEQTGGAYVVFGGPGRGRLDVGRLGDRGVRILGAQDEDMTGSRVAGVGDVNGDGLSDVVVVGARAEAFDRQVPGSRVKTRIEGAAYVVFGRRDPGTIDLRSPGSDGFVIRGVRDGDAASAGDFNGDGRPDLLVGDFATQKPDRPEPTPAERAEHEKVRKALAAQQKRYRELIDKVHGPRRVRKEAELEKVGEELRALNRKMQALQAKLPPEYENRGWVWLFLRKPGGKTAAK